MELQESQTQLSNWKHGVELISTKDPDIEHHTLQVGICNTISLTPRVLCSGHYWSSSVDEETDSRKYSNCCVSSIRCENEAFLDLKPSAPGCHFHWSVFLMHPSSSWRICGWLAMGKALWHTWPMLVSSGPHTSVHHQWANRDTGFQGWNPWAPRKGHGSLASGRLCRNCFIYSFSPSAHSSCSRRQQHLEWMGLRHFVTVMCSTLGVPGVRVPGFSLT